MSISSFCITFPLTSHLGCGLTHTFPSPGFSSIISVSSLRAVFSLHPQGASCMQNHCGSLSFKPQSLKYCSIFFAWSFFFSFPEALEGDRLSNTRPVIPVLEFAL